MTVEQKEEKVHEGREVIYASLSHIFLEPPSERTYKMLEAILPGLECLSEDKGIMAEGVEELKNNIVERNNLSDGELKEYELDILRCYTRLFCLTKCVVLSESYYTSVDKLIMQEARDNVLKYYKNSGFSMDISSNEPEDHLACEFMYMSFLAKKSKKEALLKNWDHLEKLIEIQKNFINEHILNWINSFADSLGKYNESAKIYMPMAKIAIGYVTEDAAFLEAK